LIKRYAYNIKGQVQGVGFRPFIYKLANKLNLKGFVQNNNIGVVLEVEGIEKDLDSFKYSLKNNLPPLAKIDFIKKIEITPLHKGQFEIIHSDFQSSLFPLKIVSVPPDISICQECKQEIHNTRKYDNYFALNCTNCGPRYSIIQTVPYDRENTSMKDFILCKSCLKEYKNPLNRRYHAQPTSCKNCGVTLSLYKKSSKLDIDTNELYQVVNNFIVQGMIGAIKGIGGFHIVCDATNNNVIKKLRKFKNRPTKPFALMCKDIEMINKIATVSQKEQELLLSKEAPIVLLDKNDNYIVSNNVAPNINKIGCMVAYSGFYYILFEYLDSPIIATSANLGGDPIIITKDNIEAKLPFVDFIVDYNRDIVNTVDDSVVQVVNNDILTMRLSRGYAPKEIKLPFKITKKILALGANQKSSIALAFDDKIILSPYIGDLDSLNSVEYLKRTIDTFKRFYDFEPDLIVCDKHNGYESTKLAQQFKIQNSSLKIIQIQHHLAHLFSVKAEHNLSGNYTSFIFDGTGLGDDGTLWGGEIFVNDKRRYHFKPIKLLGGTKAIKEPKRVALSILFDNYTLDEILELNLPTTKAFSKSEIKLLYHSWNKNINAPYSSSIGRYFDAIASFGDICQIQSYEGEAGLLSEQDLKTTDESFDYIITDSIIDIKFGFSDTAIVSKFYTTLVNIIVDIAKKEKLPVILSGGVWQNKTLLELTCKALDKHKIRYYYNTTTPINDSGIALGQVWGYVNNLK
jgi:hydrogenase maturation protein HypF